LSKVNPLSSVSGEMGSQNGDYLFHAEAIPRIHDDSRKTYTLH